MMVVALKKHLQQNKRPTGQRPFGLGHSSGFSLIEILVALLLIGLLYTVVTTDTFTSERQKVDETLTDLERAVRFSIDEAALRNAIIRIHFYLDKTPQEYAVEYGPSDQLLIPEFKDEEGQNKEDEEAAEKERNSFNNKFNRVKEFQDGNKKLPDGLIFLGIGSNNQEKPVTSGEASVFIFPTGERDQAIIFLGNDEEIVGLEIDAFLPEFKRNYHTLNPKGAEPVSGQELEDKRLDKMLELYNNWKKAGL